MEMYWMRYYQPKYEKQWPQNRYQHRGRGRGGYQPQQSNRHRGNYHNRRGSYYNQRSKRRAKSGRVPRVNYDESDYQHCGLEDGTDHQHWGLEDVVYENVDGDGASLGCEGVDVETAESIRADLAGRPSNVDELLPPETELLTLSKTETQEAELLPTTTQEAKLLSTETLSPPAKLIPAKIETPESEMSSPQKVETPGSELLSARISLESELIGQGERREIQLLPLRKVETLKTGTNATLDPNHAFVSVELMATVGNIAVDQVPNNQITMDVMQQIVLEARNDPRKRKPERTEKPPDAASTSVGRTSPQSDTHFDKMYKSRSYIGSLAQSILNLGRIKKQPHRDGDNYENSEQLVNKMLNSPLACEGSNVSPKDVERCLGLHKAVLNALSTETATDSATKAVTTTPEQAEKKAGDELKRRNSTESSSSAMAGKRRRSRSSVDANKEGENAKDNNLSQTTKEAKSYLNSNNGESKLKTKAGDSKQKTKAAESKDGVSKSKSKDEESSRKTKTGKTGGSSQKTKDTDSSNKTKAVDKPKDGDSKPKTKDSASTSSSSIISGTSSASTSKSRSKQGDVETSKKQGEQDCSKSSGKKSSSRSKSPTKSTKDREKSSSCSRDQSKTPSGSKDKDQAKSSSGSKDEAKSSASKDSKAPSSNSKEHSKSSSSSSKDQGKSSSGGKHKSSRRRRSSGSKSEERKPKINRKPIVDTDDEEEAAARPQKRKNDASDGPETPEKVAKMTNDDLLMTLMGQIESGEEEALVNAQPTEEIKSDNFSIISFKMTAIANLMTVYCEGHTRNALSASRNNDETPATAVPKPETPKEASAQLPTQDHTTVDKEPAQLIAPILTDLPATSNIGEQPAIPEHPVVQEEPVIPNSEEQPSTPINPVVPVQPAIPNNPDDNEQPARPVNSVVPEQPTIPNSTVVQVQPVIQNDPVVNVQPVISEQPAVANHSIVREQPVIQEQPVLPTVAATVVSQVQNAEIAVESRPLIAHRQGEQCSSVAREALGIVTPNCEQTQLSEENGLETRTTANVRSFNISSLLGIGEMEGVTIKTEAVEPEDNSTADLMRRIIGSPDGTLTVLDHLHFCKVVYPLMLIVYSNMLAKNASDLSASLHVGGGDPGEILKRNVEDAAAKLCAILNRVDVFDYNVGAIARHAKEYHKCGAGEFQVQAMVCLCAIGEPRTSFGRSFHDGLVTACIKGGLRDRQLFYKAIDVIRCYDERLTRVFKQKLAALFVKEECVVISDDDEANDGTTAPQTVKTDNQVALFESSGSELNMSPVGYPTPRETNKRNGSENLRPPDVFIPGQGLATATPTNYGSQRVLDERFNTSTPIQSIGIEQHMFDIHPSLNPGHVNNQFGMSVASFTGNNIALEQQQRVNAMQTQMDGGFYTPRQLGNSTDIAMQQRNGGAQQTNRRQTRGRGGKGRVRQPLKQNQIRHNQPQQRNQMLRSSPQMYHIQHQQQNNLMQQQSPHLNQNQMQQQIPRLQLNQLLQQGSQMHYNQMLQGSPHPNQIQRQNPRMQHNLLQMQSTHLNQIQQQMFNHGQIQQLRPQLHPNQIQQQQIQRQSPQHHNQVQRQSPQIRHVQMQQQSPNQIQQQGPQLQHNQIQRQSPQMHLPQQQSQNLDRIQQPGPQTPNQGQQQNPLHNQMHQNGPQLLHNDPIPQEGPQLAQQQNSKATQQQTPQSHANQIRRKSQRQMQQQSPQLRHNQMQQQLHHRQNQQQSPSHIQQQSPQLHHSQIPPKSPQMDSNQIQERNQTFDRNQTQQQIPQLRQRNKMPQLSPQIQTPQQSPQTHNQHDNKNRTQQDRPQSRQGEQHDSDSPDDGDNFPQEEEESPQSYDHDGNQQYDGSNEQESPQSYVLGDGNNNLTEKKSSQSYIRDGGNNEQENSQSYGNNNLAEDESPESYNGSTVNQVHDGEQQIIRYAVPIYQRRVCPTPQVARNDSPQQFDDFLWANDDEAWTDEQRKRPQQLVVVNAEETAGLSSGQRVSNSADDASSTLSANEESMDAEGDISPINTNRFIKRSCSIDSGCLVSPNLAEEGDHLPTAFALAGDFQVGKFYECLCDKPATMLCECGQSIYCSTECQENDWSLHEPVHELHYKKK